MSGDAPDRVTTDKEVSYPRAIREELGGDVLHRTNQYLNNLIEQDHRGIKQRYGPMKGFKSLESAPGFVELMMSLEIILRRENEERRSH